jgi:hypothetical protein
MTDDELPKDPLGPAAQGAAELHELFLTWIGAGFTEIQACRILGVVLAENMRNQT